MSVSAAADGFEADGMLLSESIAITSIDRSQQESGALLLQAGSGASVADGSGQAGALVVRWTRSNETSLHDPDGQRQILTIADPILEGEETYTAATWNLRSRNENADLAIAGLDLIELSSVTGPNSITPSPGEGWTTGSPPAAATNETQRFYEELKIPSGWPTSEATKASAYIAGDGTLYLWNVELDVTDASGETRTYRSGSWYSDETGAGEGLILSRTHTQFLRVSLEGARGNLTLSGNAVRWAAPVLDLTASGVLMTHVREGRLTTAQSSVDLENQPLRVDGAMRLKMEPDEFGLLRSQINFNGDATSGDQNLFPTPQAIVRLGVIPAPLFVVFAVLTAAALGLFVLARTRKSRELSLDQAEMALLSGHPARAGRRARRILVRRGEDPDAWFLYATSLLQTGRTHRLVRQLEPRMEDLGNGTGLAMVLTLAFARLGNDDAALRWLRVACRDPALRDHARTEPALMKLRGLPGFVPLLDAAAPAYA